MLAISRKGPLTYLKCAFDVECDIINTSIMVMLSIHNACHTVLHNSSCSHLLLCLMWLRVFGASVNGNSIFLSLILFCLSLAMLCISSLLYLSFSPYFLFHFESLTLVWSIQFYRMQLMTFCFMPPLWRCSNVINNSSNMHRYHQIERDHNKLFIIKMQSIEWGAR